MSKITDILKKSAAESLAASPLLKRAKSEAIAMLNGLDLPSKKDEKYIKLDVAELFNRDLQLLDPTYSEPKNIDGVVIDTISSFERSHKEILNRYFNQIASKGAIEHSKGANFKNRADLKSTLVTLNSAFLSDGRVIYFPKNSSYKEFISLDITSLESSLGYRDLIIVEENSLAKLFINNNNKHSLLNRVCEIIIGKNASLELISYNNSESSNNATINHIAVEQHENSRFKHISINLSNATIRENIKVSLNEKKCHAELLGANITYGNGVISSMTVVEHNSPECNSYEHYKNIAKNSGISDFNGHIFVDKDAQKTAAFQRNNNIVLDNTAKVFTKPQLEIYADDVKCSHGATVGQINNDALFYLRQRGISEQEAIKLLLTGFIHEILFKIDDEKIRDIITQKVADILLD